MVVSLSFSTMSRRRTRYPENCCWLPLSAAQYSQNAKIEGLFVRHRNIGDQGANKRRVAKIGRLLAEARNGKSQFEHDSHAGCFDSQ
jgi:hypothetical protein